MPAPEIIRQLVAKFSENREAYRSGRYNEARLRQEFLDPFFTALGWDVYNTKGVAPEYSDVVVEDSLEVEGTSKAPDYAFKIGRERKFFVEAKKPAVNIQYDIHPAYQLRRYAWNAHLPLSILTDFEEFAVYNCKSKPNPTDSPATSRDLYLQYTDYIDKWDEIAAIFSRDAVWKGGLDRYAETSKGKKGTTEVDDEFLKDMNEWRNDLARNIALRNEQVRDEQQLNYAVQMTIDRIIFLRICEDRGIEPEEQLKTIAGSSGVYEHLLELFRRADTKYNSGLFHFKSEKGNGNAPDTFTPGLKIDDHVLKEIIKGIYYPCPYIFKEIPVEILGQVYEQFLGKVIRLTPGHQAKVEDKPEVRKAGGVYYTPKYIVDYIVENTVGKLLEGKTPEEAAKLKIVDPACGSGSFLLGAFRYLMDWHEQWYIANDPQKWARGKNPAICEVGTQTGGSARSWRLTTQKKKEILLNNIHGVDIDPQAVEVTKLSLLLKVLEEESGQLSLGLERALPDLGKNIQCGNSLIGEDYFAGQLTVDPEERRRVNPFDWQRAFPQVFAQGGFDAVIGNPPYGAEFTDAERLYFRKFQVGTTDSAALFMVHAELLTRKFGYDSFIIPKPFLYSSTWEETRNLLLESITQISDVRKGWKEVLLEQVIYSFQKGQKSNTYISKSRNKNTFVFISEVQKSDCEFFGFVLNDLSSNEISLGKNCWNKSKNVNHFFSNTRGGMFQNKVYEEINNYKVLGGKQINRYSVNGIKGYCSEQVKKIFDNSIIQPESLLFQNIIAHIENPKPHIKLIGTLADKNTSQEYLILDTINQFKNTSTCSSKYFLGLLSSKLLNWYVYRFVFAKAIRTMHFDGPTTEKIPIRYIDFNIKSEKLFYENVTSLVDRMLALHKQTPVTPQEQEQVRREIDATDRQIDALVYQLYGLTDEEIKIVEGS